MSLRDAPPHASARRRLGAAVGYAVGLVAAAAGVHALHLQLGGHAPPPRPPATLRLSAPALRSMSFGLHHVAADVAYMRAVGTFGDKAQHEAHYPALAPLLHQSVALDPNFVAPYLLAGTALLLAGNDDAAGMTLLRQGSAHLPHVWQLPFYRGFHAYYVRQDFDEAAQALLAAARLPQAPPFMGPLATRMAAKSSDPGAGLALLDQLVATTDDAGVRASLLQRRPQLLLERRLRALRAAAAAYAQRFGGSPRSFEALAAVWPTSGAPLAEETLAEALRDPLGGAFVLQPDGTVASGHDAYRLDVYRDGKPTPRAHDAAQEGAP